MSDLYRNENKKMKVPLLVPLAPFFSYCISPEMLNLRFRGRFVASNIENVTSVLRVYLNRVIVSLKVNDNLNNNSFQYQTLLSHRHTFFL